MYILLDEIEGHILSRQKLRFVALIYEKSLILV